MKDVFVQIILFHNWLYFIYVGFTYASLSHSWKHKVTRVTALKLEMGPDPTQPELLLTCIE